MKVVALLLCVAGCAYGGSVAWPGGLLARQLVRTILPPQTKTVAYSTTQYINSLPVSYSVGYHPNFAFGVPHLSSFAPVQQTYYPVAGGSYIPASSVFYPSLTPLAPEVAIESLPSYPAGIPAGVPAGNPGGQPSGPVSSAPENPASDADTAVVDSAEYPQQQQQQDSQPATEAPASQPSTPQSLPPSNFPNFPQIPQGSPTFPQIPQIPQGSLPSFPQFPQFPSNPLFPQSPSPSPSPPSSFPGAPSSDQGLNDEDTISVESA